MNEGKSSSATILLNGIVIMVFIVYRIWWMSMMILMVFMVLMEAAPSKVDRHSSDKCTRVYRVISTIYKQFITRQRTHKTPRT